MLRLIKMKTLFLLCFLGLRGLCTAQCPVLPDPLEVEASLTNPFGGWNVKQASFSDSLHCLIEFYDGNSVKAFEDKDRSWVLLEDGKQFKTSYHDGKVEILIRPNSNSDWSLGFVLFDGKNSVVYTPENKKAWKFARHEGILKSIHYMHGKNFLAYTGVPPTYKHAVGFGANWGELTTDALQAMPGVTGQRGAVQPWNGLEFGVGMSTYGAQFSN